MAKTNEEQDEKAAPANTTAAKNCFVIMPLSEPDGYAKGHFRRVYEDILVPACHLAGFAAVRADDVKQSNLIHLDIVQKLLDAPMCLCDLSSRNPNVLFELALRQAFDKPVALVQEIGTQPIFDIAPFRYVEYHKDRIYNEVLVDQKAISTVIRDTFREANSGSGVNSIVRLLALTKSATIPDITPPEASADYLKLIMNEITQLRREVRSKPGSLTGSGTASSHRNPVVGKWLHFVNGQQQLIEFLDSGFIAPYERGAVWELRGTHLMLMWSSPDAPDGTWIDNCELSEDGTTYAGTNQVGATIQGKRIP